MEDEMQGGDGVETFETMVAGVREYLFGEAEQRVRDQLRKAQDLPREIGALTMTMCVEGSRQAQEAGVEVDMDIILGLATEVIDDLLAIAEAMGLIESADDDGLREDSLLAAVEAYLATSNAGPEEREAAMQMLAQMQGDGSMAEAAGTLAERGGARGVDPFADEQQGGPQSAPPPGPALMTGA